MTAGFDLLSLKPAFGKVSLTIGGKLEWESDVARLVKEQTSRIERRETSMEKVTVTFPKSNKPVLYTTWFKWLKLNVARLVPVGETSESLEVDDGTRETRDPQQQKSLSFP